MTESRERGKTPTSRRTSLVGTIASITEANSAMSHRTLLQPGMGTSLPLNTMRTAQDDPTLYSSNEIIDAYHVQWLKSILNASGSDAPTRVSTRKRGTPDCKLNRWVDGWVRTQEGDERAHVVARDEAEQFGVAVTVHHVLHVVPDLAHQRPDREP